MTEHEFKRIAFCTPLNPVSSGISDYSEELLPELARYFEITVFVERGIKPSNQQLVRRLQVENAGKLEKIQRRRPFDAVIYHIGNSPHHAEFYELLQRVPGVVVLHDFVLHHLMLWRAVNTLKRVDLYLGEMERRYGQAGAAVARQMLAGRNPAEVFEYPLSESVIERARGMIVHSRYVAEQVARLRPDLPSAVIPMGVPLPPLIAREAARERLGLPQEALIWASFGHINPFKRLEAALRAFRRLREEHPAALYVLVGSISPSYDFSSVIRRLGLEDAVLVTGHVPAVQFQDYVAAADVCLNLRYPTAGETSASLLRLLGAGKPVLVSSTGSFAELPADVAGQVDPDAFEERLILAYGRRLAEDRLLAEELGRRARAYVAGEHTLEKAALAYGRFLARLHGWPEPRPLREALWRLPEQAPGDRLPSVATASDAAAEPEQDSPAATIGGLIGTAAAGLGLREQDIALLDRMAGRLKQP